MEIIPHLNRALERSRSLASNAIAHSGIRSFSDVRRIRQDVYFVTPADIRQNQTQIRLDSVPAAALGRYINMVP